MPLIVPVLRLAMLFLNIYDSYKVLKPPPPSHRNANHPSLRATTQRKRSMKGCLAVWMVWCCYIVYERLLETLVCLFIPFYEELKSLAIIFLILTRARGAEPIYLHIIRPFIKPHTETVDTALDFTFLLIDIALAAVDIPRRVARGLWRRVFGRGDSASDSDEIPVQLGNPSVSAEGTTHVTSHPTEQISRSASGTISGGPACPAVEDAGQPVEPTRPHEIWYPPPSAYQDDEADGNHFQPEHHSTPASISMDSQLTLIQEMEIDEWRQYPQFPAAYPPTPLVTMMRLSSASGRANGSALPLINEMPKQDFRPSLSLPSEAMIPNSDSCLSDEYLKQGVHVSENRDSMAMSVEPDSDSSTLGEDEEEDEFNITLQTPLLARAISLSSRTNSLATTSSTHSRSTGLSTVHNGSPLRTRSSLDSVLSAALPSDEEPPMIGKKRPLQLSGNNSNQNTKVVTGPGLDSAQAAVAGDERKHKRHASRVLSSDQQNDRNDNIKASEAKKRKLESPNKIPARMPRPVGPRLARAGPPSARSQRKALPEQARPVSQKRERAGSALRTDKPAASNNGASFASTMSKSRPGGIVVSRSQHKKS